MWAWNTSRIPGTRGAHASTWQRPGGSAPTSGSCKTRAAPPRTIERMTVKPVGLSHALAAFSDIYSPRIISRVNDYDVKVAHTKGEHVWHTSIPMSSSW